MARQPPYKPTPEHPQISIGAFGLGIFDSNAETLNTAQLRAIGWTFIRAAEAIQRRQYGEVWCVDMDGEQLVSIDIDDGRPNFDFKKGLPHLATVKVETYLDADARAVPSERKAVR